jgi:hypothetical protein
MRLAKSSNLMVRATDENDRSTPCWVANTIVVDCSDVSCMLAAAPVRGVKSFGRRIRSAVPIFAPVWAKESLYVRRQSLIAVRLSAAPPFVRGAGYIIIQI